MVNKIFDIMKSIIKHFNKSETYQIIVAFLITVLIVDVFDVSLIFLIKPMEILFMTISTLLMVAIGGIFVFLVFWTS